MLVVALLACACGAGAARAERRGSIAFGGFAGYGGVFASTRATGDTLLDPSQFDYGINYGVRLRYKLRGPASLATSFEAQSFSRIGEAPSGTPHSLRINVWSFEYIRYFGRAGTRTTYVVTGVALLPSVYGVIDKNSTLPAKGDGYSLVLGAGRELLKGSRSDGIDMAFRVFPHVIDGQTGITAQVSLGINHYMEP